MQNKHNQETSTPNIILKGHKTQPTYALGWGTTKPIVASGSHSGEILVWDLGNHICPLKGFHSKPSSRGDQMDVKDIVKKTRSSKIIRKSIEKKLGHAGENDDQIKDQEESRMSSSDSGGYGSGSNPNVNEENSQAESEDESMHSDNPGQPKTKIKTLQRIQKNISSYLNDPTPTEKNK